jgi:hypothetical protein
LTDKLKVTAGLDPQLEALYLHQTSVAFTPVCRQSVSSACTVFLHDSICKIPFFMVIHDTKNKSNRQNLSEKVEIDGAEYHEFKVVRMPRKVQVQKVKIDFNEAKQRAKQVN